MKENQFQSNIVKYLEKYGAKILNVHGGRFQKSGWPDLYIAHFYWKGWLELKVEGRKPTPQQEEVIYELYRRGVNAYVLTADDKLGESTLQIFNYKGESLKTFFIDQIVDHKERGRFLIRILQQVTRERTD